MDTQTSNTEGVNNTPVTRKVIVSGNLGNWIINQELTKDADIIKYYRDCLMEGGTDMGITDEIILDAVDNIGTDELPEDADVLRVQWLEELVPND